MELYKGFDARRYLIERYPTTLFEEDQTKIMSSWDILCYHKFYQTFNKEWDNTNTILLEIGGGPCIYALISAAPYVAEIYHTDYVESCCNEVLMWKNADPDAYNWSPYFRHVVSTLEGQVSLDAVAKRESQLRRILKDPLTCDVRNEPIVPNMSKPVDIICANFSLETTLPTMTDFEHVMKVLFDMLNPKGFLLLLCSLGCSWYLIKEAKFPCIYLRLENIENAAKKAGFVVRTVESKDKALSGRNIYNDTTGHAFVVVQKPEQNQQEPEIHNSRV
ncbi:nicotinamide N-methyltransferase-like [Dysidea avara]|uniref:nicotinamide N-methyltransferase-like n=1 Tax=Dysidea avara TaxID=196820 RepID=UPI003327E241